MRRKIGIFGSLIALAGLVVAAVATSAPAITTAQRFTLIGPQGEFRSLDLGPKGASLGDQIIFSGPLRKRDGTRAGRYDGFCVLTSKGARASEQRQQCFLTSTIGTANGETEIQSGGVGRIQAEDVYLSVAGGSGRFQNVRGQLLLTFRQNRVILKYSLIP